MILTRRNDVDGLRALAVTSVVIYHAFSDLLKGGFVGVDVFFVISGYVITRLIFAEMQAGTFSFLNFYLRRVRRLYPALLIVIVFTLFMGWHIQTADEYLKVNKVVAAQFFYLNNFLNAFSVSYFDPFADELPLTHLWSLAVEEQFYLFWPFLLFFCLKKHISPKKLLLILSLLSFGASLILIKYNHNFAFFLPFGRFFEMMVGALLAFEEKNPSINARLQKKYGEFIFILGLGLILYSFFFVKSNEQFPGFPVLLPVLGTGLVIYAGIYSSFNQLLFANKYMVGIGLISYPLYLWHWPLFSFQFITQAQEIEPWLRFGMVLLSVILAYFTYILIEKPFQKAPLKSSAFILYITMACVALFAFYIVKNNGLTSRQVLVSANSSILEINKEFTVNHEGFMTCYESFGKIAMSGYRCINEKEKTATPLLLFGDSTASALHKAAYDTLPNLKIFWRPGCPPFVLHDLKGALRKEFSECLDYSQFFHKYLEKNKTMQAVLIKSRLPAQFTFETNLDEEERLFSQKYGIMAENKFEIAYFNSYRLFLERLHSKIGDKKIVVLYANPVFDKFSTKCFVRPLRLQSPTYENCHMSKETHEQRYAYYRRLMGALEKLFPHITFIKTEQNYCNEKGCSFIQNNRLTYGDNLHLTPSGVAPIIKDLLKALPMLK